MAALLPRPIKLLASCRFSALTQGWTSEFQLSFRPTPRKRGVGRNPASGKGAGNFLEAKKDSAEKALGMLRRAQHEREISNDLNCSSVRPEALEG